MYLSSASAGGGNSSPLMESGLCLALRPLDLAVLGEARTKLSESFHSGLLQEPLEPTDAGRPEKKIRPRKDPRSLPPPFSSSWREFLFQRSITMTAASHMPTDRLYA